MLGAANRLAINYGDTLRITRLCWPAVHSGEKIA